TSGGCRLRFWRTRRRYRDVWSTRFMAIAPQPAAARDPHPHLYRRLYRVAAHRRRVTAPLPETRAATPASDAAGSLCATPESTTFPTLTIGPSSVRWRKGGGPEAAAT